MSKLERLLAELCPNGVEYKTLGEICKKIYSGKNKHRSDKGRYFIYGSTGVIGYSDTFIYEHDAILIARVGANCGYVYIATGCYDVSDNTLILEPKEGIYNLKFAYYQLTNMNLNQFAKGGGQPLITAGQLKELTISIPPLPIQQEIVRILDKFTMLEAKLEAELELRKKQYQYYRNSLLTFNINSGTIKKTADSRRLARLMTLGEVAMIQSGGTPSKNKKEYWTNGTIKWLGSTVCRNRKTVDEVTDYITEEGLKKSSAKMLKEQTTLIALVGATIGKVAFLPFEAAVNQNIAALYPIDTDQLNASYLYYACCTLYEKFTALSNEKFSMANLSFVRGLIIPVPSLEEQERIVSILDRFDALTNDITSGLPAEIAARRKQYEYYRNKLLMFMEVV